MKKMEEIINQIYEVQKLLQRASSVAYEASCEYSTDSESRLAFEVGHLNGWIKTAVQELEIITMGLPIKKT